MRKESLEFLKQLLTTPTPSGCESAGQRIWCNYARKFADEVRTDAYGNAVAIVNPKGDPRIMFDGHIDELGLIVKHIDEKGFLYFQRVGGVDPALVRSKRVNIHTAKGVIRGVIGATAIHLIDRSKGEQKAPKMHECWVDIGAADGEDARKRVQVGDVMTFVDEFEMLNEHVASARAFDNRVGAWAALEAVRLAAKEKLNCCLVAVSSIQEELGLHGAQMNVVNVAPDAAIAIDVTHATDTPGIDPKEHGEIKLGKGPSISIGRENHPVILDRLRKAAKRKKIALQVETFSTTGGTDALAIFTKLGGVPSAIVGIPDRYMHTTVETMDLRDIEKTAELLAAFALDIKKGDRFKVKV
ncbi:MAG: putative aminopeptidase YsdC [Planctomycetes bacterium ADurb.Bin126]|nr:MAG: putative aminopeptidase YsdC [Planctomycetes bacterium ADurb.Bin126]HOD83355.1 M42 family metallopeptidase [Phycisphaerae bacterium]HQL76105.1 M42 family metallopeptidase [Phycisphaerae bacterium]